MAAVAVEEFAAITTLIQTTSMYLSRAFQGSRNSAPPISSNERAE
jgi:hypothetical protein